MSNKQDVLVSVIIPLYNVRPYLAEAIESAAHQTYQNLEIILIDDGSTDGSGRICDDYAAADPRIRVIHQENKGISSARNKGLETMTGEIAAFLDSDDAYHPEYISTMLEAMERSGSDMATCRWSSQPTTGKLRFDKTGNLSFAMKEGTYDRVTALRAYYDGKFASVMWNKLYKRELWENERFPEGHVFEDLDTSYRVLNNCHSVCVLNDVLYAYRTRPGSITDIPSKKSISDRFLAYSHYDAFVREHVPEVFPAEAITQLQQRRMKQKISYYAYLSREKDPELKKYSEELRRQVIASGKKAQLRDYDLSTQAYYRMIRVCPWLLRATVPVFYPVRQFVKRAFREKK